MCIQAVLKNVCLQSDSALLLGLTRFFKKAQILEVYSLDCVYDVSFVKERHFFHIYNDKRSSSWIHFNIFFTQVINIQGQHKQIIATLQSGYSATTQYEMMNCSTWWKSVKHYILILAHTWRLSYGVLQNTNFLSWQLTFESSDFVMTIINDRLGIV